MELAGGGKSKSSYRGCIVNLKVAEDTAFLTTDLLLTLSLAICSQNDFVYLSSAQD